jgi:uncharacterized protein (TIGR00251 family)
MSWLRTVPGGVELRLKVVPGASRSAVAGVLGDRLKVRISAPPEGGKANRAVEDLLAELTGCVCTVTSGHGSPQKTLFVATGSPVAVRQAVTA